MRRNPAGFILLTVISSCGSTKLQPQVLAGPLSTRELIKGSQVIVVGTVTSITFGKIVHTNIAQLEDCLAPVVVGVSVENVLRGSLPNHLDYLYFGTVCGTMGPVESPEIGSRSVFFLRRDSGHWRPLADYWINRIPVLTGAHDNALPIGKPIEQAVSEFLLVPGDNYSAERLVQAIATSTTESSNLIGASATARLLRPLLDHADIQVRMQACLRLNEFEDSSSDCASRLVGESLDLFTRRGFGTISQALAADLGQLAAYSDTATLGRAQRFLPLLRSAAPAVAPLKPSLR